MASKGVLELKKFDCELEKMACFSDLKGGDLNSDPDNCVTVWVKRIKAKGIKLALKQISTKHKVMKLEESFDKINPNYIRCYVDTSSNYYQDLRGLDGKEYGDDTKVGVGMVMLHIHEVRIKPSEDDPKGKDWNYGEEIRNHGYFGEENWF